MSRLPVVTAAVLAIALAGCGSADQAEIEGEIVDKLSPQVKEVAGTGIESASCPGDVELEQGTTFECKATLDDGAKVSVDGEVTSDEGNVEFTVPPDDLIEAGIGKGT